MKQTTVSTKRQLSMDLHLENCCKLMEMDQDAVVTALAELLLEAHGQEMQLDAVDQEPDHEC